MVKGILKTDIWDIFLGISRLITSLWFAKCSHCHLFCQIVETECLVENSILMGKWTSSVQKTSEGSYLALWDKIRIHYIEKYLRHSPLGDILSQQCDILSQTLNNLPMKNTSCCPPILVKENPQNLFVETLVKWHGVMAKTILSAVSL